MSILETNQFTVYATFQSKPGQYDALKDVNQKSFELSKNAPGLMQMFWLDPPKPDAPFVFIAFWRSKEDFQNFMQSPQAQQFHNAKNIRALMDSAMEKATAQFYTLADEGHVEH